MIMNVHEGQGETEQQAQLTLREVEGIEEMAGLGRPVMALRQEALTRFLALPFPTSNHELWRYTKPDMFAWGRVRSPSKVEFGLTLVESPSRNSEASRGSGTESSGKSSSGSTPAALPPGVTLSTDFSGYAGQLEDLFGDRAADLETNAPAQMLLAAASGGCVIHVAAGKQIKEPLFLSQIIEESAITAIPLVVILVDKGSSVTLVEDIDLSSFTGLLAPRVEVLIQDNASLEFVSIQRLSNSAQYLARHRFHLLRDSHLKSVHVALGANISRLDLDCKLWEPGAQADMYSLYLGAGGRHVDFHPTQWHLAPHCRSNLYCKGALKDVSRSVYFGYIRVAEAAQKTDAYQTNRNLLLSTEARADAIPNLEIKANDVKCSHGASVGQVGADELFYLMSRGLPRAAAEKLLVEGFFADLMAKISSEFARSTVDRVVMEQLYA
jgi:Fe-S cluster assembly protein SufD